MDDLAPLVSPAGFGPPATAEQVAAAEEALGRRLPTEYVAFMRRFGAGEGPVGAEGWMRLEPIDRLAGVRDDHSAIDHLAGRTVVGGNGGGEAYVLDGAGNVLVVPYIGSERDAIPQGSFSAFLRRQAAGTTFDR